MSARLTTSRRAFLLAAGLSAAMLPRRSVADGEPGAPLRITGELTYLQRAALPGRSVAIVEIKPSDSPDGAPVTAEADIALDGSQVPVAFTLEIPRERLNPGKAYVVRGAIRNGSDIRWLSEPVEVDIRAAELDLGMLVMSAYDPPAPFDLDDPAAIQDIEWRITEMAGAAIPEDAFVTLTFGRDGAFHGGACNRFRGSYRLQRRSLSFGRVAGTLMACPEPQMTLERTLFDTLGRVKGYALTRAGPLRLTDADDGTLIVARP